MGCRMADLATRTRDALESGTAAAPFSGLACPGLSRRDLSCYVLYLALGGKLMNQLKHTFQVIGLGKKIHHVSLLNTVSSPKQAGQVATRRRWIARNVNHAPCSQPCQPADDRFPKPTARRINHNQIGTQLVHHTLPELLRCLRNSLHIGW